MNEKSRGQGSLVRQIPQTGAAGQEKVFPQGETPEQRFRLILIQVHARMIL